MRSKIRLYSGRIRMSVDRDLQSSIAFRIASGARLLHLIL
jgi:hypothetical protein